MVHRAAIVPGSPVGFRLLVHSEPEVKGVEPTDNRAERGLRGAVIYRKISLGSQSEAGERFAERMLSVSQTCRLQGRSLSGFLIEAITASSRASPAPSLV